MSRRCQTWFVTQWSVSTKYVISKESLDRLLREQFVSGSTYGSRSRPVWNITARAHRRPEVQSVRRHYMPSNVMKGIHLIRLCLWCVTFFMFQSITCVNSTAELRRRIQAMEMRCYRKILHISCKDHVTNEEVRVKI